MDERSDSGGAIVAIGVVLILFLLLIAGGGFVYVLFARTTATVRAQADMARVAEAQAQMNVAKARAAENSAVAQAAAQLEQLSKATQEGSIPAGIEGFLRVQEQAWNAGDIDQFMEHYWKSDELTFSSGGQTTRGWNNTLNRYRERYPTPDKMGKLKFDKLEITTLGDGAALVLGQWQVERESEPLSGNFSLVVRKFAGRWLIIHDHTSRLSK